MFMGIKATKKSWIKKILTSVLVASIMLALTGCIRYSTTMTVGTDGKMDLEILYAVYDTSSLSDDADTDDEDQKEAMEKLEEEGWKVKEYTKDSYKGYELSKKGIKVADLADELQRTDLGFDKFTISESKGVYTIDWDVSGNTSEASDSGVELDKLAEYGGYMKFVLELPNKADKQNATTVSKSGKTLEWDMFKMDENIHCEFKITGGGGFPAWAIGLIIGGVVIAIGVVVAIIVMNKKKAAPAVDTTAPYASAIAPNPVVPQAPAGFPQAAPTAPAAPATPFQPQAPVAPAAPATPFQPQAPAAPAAPVNPFQPQAPVAPETPANDTPSDPGAPVV